MFNYNYTEVITFIILWCQILKAPKSNESFFVKTTECLITLNLIYSNAK